MFNLTKKIIFLFFLFAFSFSCNKTSLDDSISRESEIKSEDYPCIALIYVIDDFKFHRPKFDCLKGFWFCFTGHWEITYDCGNLTTNYNSQTNQVTVYAEIISENKLIIHYPKELTDLYSSEDLAKLSADNDYEISDGITIKKGEYPVEINSNDITVVVDIL